MLGGHIHLVNFDVLSSDGSSNGWNYQEAAFTEDQATFDDNVLAGTQPCSIEAGCTVPLPDAATYDPTDPAVQESWLSEGQTLKERWFADYELRTVFMHDHHFANVMQNRGMFNALLVEPTGFDSRDPATGEYLQPINNVGTRHGVHHDVRGRRVRCGHGHGGSRRRRRLPRIRYRRARLHPTDHSSEREGRIAHPRRHQEPGERRRSASDTACPRRWATRAAWASTTRTRPWRSASSPTARTRCSATRWTRPTPSVRGCGAIRRRRSSRRTEATTCGSASSRARTRNSTTSRSTAPAGRRIRTTPRPPTSTPVRSVCPRRSTSTTSRSAAGWARPGPASRPSRASPESPTSSTAAPGWKICGTAHGA